MGRTNTRPIQGLRTAFLAAIAATTCVVAPIVGADAATAAGPDRIDVTTTADVIDPNDGHTSLREAVSAAAATPGPTVVRLSRNAAYELQCAQGPAEDAGLSGDLDHHTTDLLKIVGRGATISNAPGCAGQRLLDTGHLELRNITLTGGNDVEDGGAIRVAGDALLRNVELIGNESQMGSGGAISVSGQLVMRGSLLADNRAGYIGGGIHAGQLRFIDSIADANRATHDGGALAITGGTSRINRAVLTNNVSEQGRGGALVADPVTEIVIANTTATGNRSLAHAFGGGGAVYVDGHLRLNRSEFVDNSAQGTDDGTGAIIGGNGGAVYVRGSADVRNTTLQGNTAGITGHGGAVFVAGALSMRSSTMDGNTAGGFGGAVASVENHNTGTGALDVATTDFVGNAAAGGGGGVWAHQPTPMSIRRSSFAGNSASSGFGQGGAVHVEGELELRRTTITQNGADGGGASVFLDVNTEVALHASEIVGNGPEVVPSIAGPGEGTSVVTFGSGVVYDGIVTASATVPANTVLVL